MSRRARGRISPPLLFAFAISIGLLAACSQAAVSTPAGWACPYPPHEVSRGDLVGTWAAEYGAATDVLAISSDGTFLQTYTRQSDGYAFTSQGQWNLEDRESGGYYLHLRGMRRCDDTDELCADPEGGSGDHPWFDFCEGRFLVVPDEVVLLVTGEVHSQGLTPSPGGIWLRHLALDSSSGSFYFTRGEP
jgi:hypothetical protein